MKLQIPLCDLVIFLAAAALPARDAEESEVADAGLDGGVQAMPFRAATEMMGSPGLPSTTLTRNFDAFDMNAGRQDSADAGSFKDSATNLCASSRSPALRPPPGLANPGGERQLKVESTKMCQGQVIQVKYIPAKHQC